MFASHVWWKVWRVPLFISIQYDDALLSESLLPPYCECVCVCFMWMCVWKPCWQLQLITGTITDGDCWGKFLLPQSKPPSLVHSHTDTQTHRSRKFLNECGNICVWNKNETNIYWTFTLSWKVRKTEASIKRRWNRSHPSSCWRMKDILWVLHVVRIGPVGGCVNTDSSTATGVSTLQRRWDHRSTLSPAVLANSSVSLFLPLCLTHTHTPTHTLPHTHTEPKSIQCPVTLKRELKARYTCAGIIREDFIAALQATTLHFCTSFVTLFRSGGFSKSKFRDHQNSFQRPIE